MKYRIYIDEVGNPDLGSSLNPNQRYLSLTGVILELGYVNDFFFFDLENLKRRFFKSHPDDPIVFHRKELVNKQPPFAELRDPEIEAKFNTELLTRLQTWQYTVITVVIDKLQHTEQYQTWRYDPYHYCLKVLIERYVRWLQARRTVGDVLADIIAHPSYKVALARRNNEAIPKTFGGQIGQILLESKYDRSPSGRVDGWGIKWLP